MGHQHAGVTGAAIFCRRRGEPFVVTRVVLVVETQMGELNLSMRNPLESRFL
jgi:hypothetical protein